MELYDEDDFKKNKKGKKIVSSLLVLSIVLLLIIGGIVLFVPKKIEVKAKLSIDGVVKTIPTGLFYTSEDEITYVSISGMAGLIEGYEYYRGEYNNPYTEDSTKCYILSNNEATTFIQDSDYAYKTDPKNELKYEYYKIAEPVISVNDKLYATMDIINIAFNCRYITNKETKETQITTLGKVYKDYQTKFSAQGASLSTKETVKVKEESKVQTKEQTFSNKKALVYGMAIINRNNKFGVVSFSGSTIIGTKYDKINFVEERKEFIVTSDKKVGLLSEKGETEIELNYDTLELLDGVDDYYLVSQNSRYGILKSSAEIVLPVEFEKINYKIINNKKMYYVQKDGEIMTMEDYLSQS